MITGFDHVALPMENVDEMLSFYTSLGADIREEIPNILHAVYLGSNKINLHMPKAWQSPRFTLRGPAAKPGCGDLCFVWEGTMQSLQHKLASIGAEVIEGPGNKLGGRGVEGCSVYVRDPDQNLLEFMVYEQST